MYNLGIFVWDDTDDILITSCTIPEPYYKVKTERTARPYIPLTQKEFNYVLSEKGQKELEIVHIYLSIKQNLKSRNFIAAKKLLPTLGKLNKQDYSDWASEDFPNCILLRLFNIQNNE
jgi:hypothetical protein